MCYVCKGVLGELRLDIVRLWRSGELILFECDKYNTFFL